MSSDRSLAEELDAVRARVTARDAARRAHQTVLERLTRSGAAAGARQVGDRVAPFALPDAEGRLVSLADLLARGPLVLAFFRGDWCPYCRAAMAALNAAQPAIAAAGASLAGVVPDAGGVALGAKQTHGLGFPVLCDIDHGVGAAFGLTFPMPDNYRRLLHDAGVDLGARHGHGGWFVPIPACFVIDRDAVIRYAFVDIDFTRRAEPADVIAALRGLTASRSAPAPG